MTCNWFFWYVVGIHFTMVHMLVFRPFVAKGMSSRQMTYSILLFPVFFGWLTLLDLIDQDTRRDAMRIGVFTVLTASAYLYAEHRVRSHAMVHTTWRHRINALREHEGEDYVMCERAYIEHISPRNDAHLPLPARIEHKILRVLYSISMFDIDLDGEIDYDSYMELDLHTGTP